jgi:hypothetical protein
MIADTTELISFPTFSDSGVGTADTFNTWRKKSNGLIQHFNNLELNNSSSGLELNNTNATIRIKVGGVITQNLANDAVIESKIANIAVTSSKIANDAVIGSKIANDAVTTPKIANDAVIGSKIANLAVTSSKIANDAVIGSKIANDAVTTLKIANGSVIGSKIAYASIEPNHLIGGASWPIDSSGTSQRALTLAQNGGGVGMIFNWAGQPGQPDWLWGGWNGTNHYVFNPSNFNVANAVNASYATNGAKSWIFLKNHVHQASRGGWAQYRYGAGFGSWLFQNSDIRADSCVVVSGGGYNSAFQQITGVSLDEVGAGYCIIRSFRDGGNHRGDTYCLSIAVFNHV